MASEQNKNNPKMHVLIFMVLRNDTLKWRFGYNYMLLTFCCPLWAMEHEKHPFLKKNVEDAVRLKNTPFRRSFGHGCVYCVASHVASDPPPPPPPRVLCVQTHVFAVYVDKIAYFVQTIYNHNK